MIDSANFGLLNRLDCKALTSNAVDTLANGAVVARSTNEVGDRVVDAYVRVTASDGAIMGRDGEAVARKGG